MLNQDGDDQEVSPGANRGGLRSERYQLGSPQPIGFVWDPRPDFTETAGALLSALASAISDPAPAPRLISVRLSHFRFHAALSPSLFGFSVYDFDDAGEWIDPLTEGNILRYALVLNQPIEVQLETALTFLLQLVGRSTVTAENTSPAGFVPRLFEESEAVDAQATAMMADTLRYGWQAAAGLLRERARDSGIGFSVTYAPDLFSEQDQLARRIPQLKALYNDNVGLRDIIDRVVSAVGGSEPRVVMPTAPQERRDRLQRSTGLLNNRQSISQTMRDALVCGNGYLCFSGTGGQQLYNLRPELAHVSGSRVFVDSGRDGLREAPHTMHVKGIEQIHSPYGLSLLEPFLPQLRQQQAFRRALEIVAQIKAVGDGAAAEARQWAKEMEPEALSIIQKGDQDLERRLMIPRKVLTNPPAAGLYFEGQELMG